MAADVAHGDRQEIQPQPRHDPAPWSRLGTGEAWQMIPAWYSNLTPDTVLDAVANCHRTTVRDITGPSRLAYIVHARRDAMRLLRALGLSLPAIGRMLNRDHSVVLRGLRRAG